MKFASSSILGIAITDQTITCAQLSVRADHRSVQRTAVFTLTPELSLSRPDALGQALATFLRQHGFSASRAAVGVPARWLIAVEKEVPPANKEQAYSMLRLAAERLPLTETGETVFDYAGQHESGKPGKVLLLAMLRKQLERVEQTMDAAGIAVIAVTPTALALSAASRVESPMLMLNRFGAEVVWPQHGTPRLLRHFSMAASNGHGGPALGPLGLELRRTVALQASSTNGTTEIAVFDGLGLSDTELHELSDRMGMKVRSADGAAMLGLRSEAGSVAASKDVAPGQFAGAMALAVVGAKRNLLPMDLAHSRLAPRPKPKFSRQTILGATVGLIAVIILGAIYIDTLRTEGEIAAADASLKANEIAVKDAQSALDRVNYSQGYFRSRTPVLETLRQITQTFRDDEEIWATTVIIQDAREGPQVRGKPVGPLVTKGQIKGKAVDDQTVTKLANRLLADRKFSDVNQLDTSKGAGRTREWIFTIAFTFDASK